MEPYLSVVVASRNDNHGGDLLKRMQLFVTALLEQCRRHQIPAELIIVEWNPPADRPRLMEALRWSDGPCAVRVIEVPVEIHRGYGHAEGLPLYQMIAKNVGIRRARGSFVLATNIDILFSDELMQFIAARKLERGRMYRVDRYDAMADVPDGPVEAQLAWCASHLIRVHSAAGTSSVTADGGFTFERDDIGAGGITLGRGWFARELQNGKPFRWVDNDAEIFVNGTGTLTLDVAPGPGVRMGPVMLQILDDEDTKLVLTRVSGRRILKVPARPRLRIHVEGGGHRMENEPRPLNICARRIALGDSGVGDVVRRIGWTLRRVAGRMVLPAPKYAKTSPDFLHLTACGDFTMMAREHWVAVRGYPEFDMFAMNLDSLLCWAAHYSGARELVLDSPMRAYHIEHAEGSGWTPEGQAKLFEGLKAKGVPWLDQTEMLRKGFEMSRTNEPMIFNPEDWGLAVENLRETQRPA